MRLSSRDRSRAALIATAFLLGACSTAQYGKTVNAFAAATGEAESALAQLNTELAQGYGEVLESRALGGQAFVRIKGNECQTRSERCRLVVIGRDGVENDYPPTPPLTRMTLVMTQISRYAANLKALVEADTARQAEADVNAALASTQNLAQTVAGLGGPGGQPVPAFAAPAGAAANWIVGQYVEHVKFAGLQRATAAAKPAIRDAGTLFVAVADIASDAPRAVLAEEVSQTVDAFRAGRNKANLTAMARSAGRLDAFLTSAPPQMFQKMVAAHDALADSLQGGSVTLVDAVARIEAFAAEAKKLAAILKDLRAVVPAKQGG